MIVLDPMLATGGSAIDAITIVKRSHPKSIKFLCIIAAPEGLEALTKAHPGRAGLLRFGGRGAQ